MIAKLIKKLGDKNIGKRPMILTFIYSGMKRGELLALTWYDFDFDDKTVNINKSLQYLSG
jgi:integrase